MGFIEYLGQMKNRMVSDRICFRKVLFGISRGYVLPLNLSSQFREFIGYYEMEIANYVKSYVHPGYCCYDIGASVGYYTLALSRLAHSGQVFSFEADKKYCDLLEDAIIRNRGIKSEITILNYFVGNSVNEENGNVSIDHLVFDGTLPPPDFIKMDIEGAEYEAFLGAQKVLKEFAPKIIVEVHSEKLGEDCSNMLSSSGYRVIRVNQDSFLPKREGSYNGWLCCERID